MEGRKFGGEIKANRRALGVINQNQHCVVNKRGFAEYLS